MSAVRLWHIALLGDEGWCARRPGDNWLAETTAYIAIPAAEYAALVALLGDLQEYLDTGIVDVPRAVALSNRVTQALACLGGAGNEGSVT